MNHEKVETHKHLAEPQTTYQRVVMRMLTRILELSTLELVVATLHLALTAAAIFGLVGGAGGEGGGH